MSGGLSVDGCLWWILQHAVINWRYQSLVNLLEPQAYFETQDWWFIETIVLWEQSPLPDTVLSFFILLYHTSENRGYRDICCIWQIFGEFVRAAGILWDTGLMIYWNYSIMGAISSSRYGIIVLPFVVPCDQKQGLQGHLLYLTNRWWIC